MKKALLLTCLASVLALTGFTGNEIKNFNYNPVMESEETLDVSSFLDAVDISWASNEAETDTDSFPSSFDLRSCGIATKVKQQGKYGTCWAIAASDSIENQIVRSGYEASPDLSEWHFAYFTYRGEKPFLSSAENVFNSGGTNTIAAASLARWQGMVREETVPYGSSSAIDASMQFDSDYKVTDVYNVHSIVSNHIKHSEDFMKELIYSQNAVSAAYYSREEYYNENTYSHYCYDSGTGIDHAVVLLGWDDNYPKENFRAEKRPENDGAWLAKNSWGEEWGDGGYFWISYEDKSLCEAGCYYSVPGDTYSTNYQYDETGWAVSISADGNQKKLSGYMANVFTAENNDPITAVSFYTTEDDADYEIYVYTDVKTGSKNTSPVNGTLASEKSGSQKYAGYHTVVLDTPVEVAKGDVFSVAVKLTNHTSPYVIPMEASSATASAGFFSTRTYLFHQYGSEENDPSYISLDGNSWYKTTGKTYSYSYTKYLDLVSTLQNLRSVTLGNVCLKALASPAGTAAFSPTEEKTDTPAVTEPEVTEPEITETEVTTPSETTAPVKPEITLTTTTPAVTEAVTSSEPPVTTAAPVTTEITAVTTVQDTPLKDDIYDINMDGKTNAADLVLMMNIFFGTETEKYRTDLNEDGVTNIVDIIVLKERLTGTKYNTK